MDSSNNCGPYRFKVSAFCKSCKHFLCYDMSNLEPCREKCPVVYAELTHITTTAVMSSRNLDGHSGTHIEDNHHVVFNDTTNEDYHSLTSGKLEPHTFAAMGYSVPISIIVFIVLIIFLLHRYNERMHKMLDEIWDVIRRFGNDLHVYPEENIPTTFVEPTAKYVQEHLIKHSMDSANVAYVDPNTQKSVFMKQKEQIGGSNRSELNTGALPLQSSGNIFSRPCMERQSVVNQNVLSSNARCSSSSLPKYTGTGCPLSNNLVDAQEEDIAGQPGYIAAGLTAFSIDQMSSYVLTDDSNDHPEGNIAQNIDTYPLLPIKQPSACEETALKCVADKYDNESLLSTISECIKTAPDGQQSPVIAGRVDQGFIDVASQCNAPSRFVTERGSFPNLPKLVYR